MDEVLLLALTRSSIRSRQQEDRRVLLRFNRAAGSRLRASGRCSSPIHLPITSRRSGSCVPDAEVRRGLPCLVARVASNSSSRHPHRGTSSRSSTPLSSCTRHHEQLLDCGSGELELPWSDTLRELLRLMTGGTFEQRGRARPAGGGVAANIGGGFHHAFADHGEGFCLFNDVAWWRSACCNARASLPARR